MSSSLENSYRFCEQLARRSGSNFFLAFRTLPREMYRQMCVLYAFMRHTDDLSDQDGVPLAVRRDLLQGWKSELTQALAGTAAQARGGSPILPALAHVSELRQIPQQYLTEVIHGVEGDLTPRSFETFAELEHYCYQVAGVVGLCCLKIWGYRGEEPLQAAIACGTAFQLTNVLRDLKEDAQRGRIYLPRGEMSAWGYSTESLQAGRYDDSFRDLMKSQVNRAWAFYRQAFSLQEQLSVPGRRIFLAFFDLYSSLLREIERADFDVLSQRVHLSRWKKASVALRCLLRINSSGASSVSECIPLR